jgi:hypothetical protein
MHGTDHTGKTGRGGEFAKQATQWPTPQARDEKNANLEGSGNYQRKLAAGFTIDLNDRAVNWATPQAHDSAVGNPDRVGRFGTEHGGRNLTDEVTLWATPCVPNGGRTMSEEDVLNKGTTAKGKRQVGLEMQSRYSRLDPPTNDGPTSSAKDPTSRRRLNPRFVEWLMGFPPGWTEL